METLDNVPKCLRKLLRPLFHDTSVDVVRLSSVSVSWAVFEDWRETLVVAVDEGVGGGWGLRE